MTELWLRRRVPDDLVLDVSDLDWCQLFHCLPSQLDEEDYHRLHRLSTIHNAMESWRSAEERSRLKSKSK